MKKRILSLALASAMAVGTVGGAFAETEVVAEVKTSPQYINGYEDGTFRSVSHVSRAEIAKMVAMIQGLEETEESFDDVPNDHWAAGFIGAVQEAGIVEGDDLGNFNPADGLTRAELATIVSRVIEDSEGEGTEFSDVEGHWAADAIAKVSAAGIINGYPDGSFKPNAKVTRAESVKMLNAGLLGMLEIEDGAVSSNVENPFSDDLGWAEEHILAASAEFEYTLEDGKLVDVMVAAKVESVSVATDEDVATVSAVVKNAEEGAKATVEIYANGDTTAAPAATKEVSIVDGAVSSEFAGLPAGNHVARVKVGESSKDANFTITISELAVQSVSAINLNQLMVTFSQEVDETSAETATNYELGGVVLTASDKIDLQSDKKTVIINLDGARAQYATATFKVKGNLIYGTDLVKTVPVYESDLTFSDTAVPTVKSVKVTGNKKLTVEFSETVKANPAFVTAAGTKFKINGQNITNLGFSSATALNLTGTSAYTNKIELNFATALPTGDHTLTVLKNDGTNLVDAAGFGLAEQTVDFTIANVTDAPAVVSVEGENNGTVYVTFNRSMDANALTVSNYEINDAAMAGAIASFKSGTDSKVVKFTNVPGVSKGANVLTIKKDTVKDTFGNKLDADNNTRLSFTATEDKTKPVVTSVTPVTNKKVRVKFSESVNSTYATNTSNYKIKTSSGTTITGFTVATTSEADTYEINFTAALTGANYSLEIKNIVDLAATPNVMDTYTTTFNGIDDVAPEVVNNGIFKSGDRKVAVVFNEAMDASTITNAANYQYEDNASPAVTRSLPSGTTLIAGAENKSVEITFPASYEVNGAAATQYSVKKLNVSNVKDVAGNTLKNISTGLQVIQAASTATQADYVAETFKLTSSTGKVTAEFEMSQTITSLTIADFKVQGNAPTSGYMSGKKVVLEFTNTGAIAAIKAAGKDAALTTEAVTSSTDVYGTKIKPSINVAVYEDAIAPEVTGVAIGSAANKINITFSEAIDGTIAGLYTNDFTVESGGALVSVTGATVTGNVLELTLASNLTQSAVVKAVEANIDVRDLQDAAETRNKYVPTTTDKNGRTITVASAPALTGAAVADKIGSGNDGVGTLTTPVAPTGATKFKYQVGASASPLLTGQDVTAWTDIAASTSADVTLGANAVAANGKVITLAAVDANNKVVSVQNITVSGIADYIAGTKQVETATTIALDVIDGAGNYDVTVTAADGGNLAGGKTISVAVSLGDTASDVAGKVRAALLLDADVTNWFDVSGAGSDVVLTAKAAAANDATANLSLADGTSTATTSNGGVGSALTAVPNSANTAVGVADAN